MKRILLVALICLAGVSYGQLSAPNGTVTSTTNPSTGNVGIGLTAPAARLDVNTNLPTTGTYNSQYWSTSNPNYNLLLQTIWDGNGIRQGFVQKFNGTNHNVLSFYQGNVGMGVSTPKSKLHVSDAGRDYYVNRAISGTTEDAQGKNYILLHRAYTSSVLDDRYVIGKISAVRGGTAAWNRKVTLEVNSATAYNKDRGSLISYNEPVRLVYLTFGGQRYVAIEISSDSRLYSLTFTGYAYNEELQIVYDQSVTNVADFTALDPIILQASSVGVGTMSPDAALTVNGTIHSKEVKVDLNVPGPDYVFEETYQLPSLTEVACYIQQHKHLPEIPSANEMEENGVQLGEMNMMLLMKIEELTLYVIEQQKEIEHLKTLVYEQK